MLLCGGDLRTFYPESPVPSPGSSTPSPESRPLRLPLSLPLPLPPPLVLPLPRLRVRVELRALLGREEGEHLGVLTLIHGLERRAGGLGLRQRDACGGRVAVLPGGARFLQRRTHAIHDGLRLALILFAQRLELRLLRVGQVDTAQA